MRKRIRVVELYGGTGRSFEPFRRWRRAELALIVDRSEFAAQTYRDNFPNAPYLLRDLATMPLGDLTIEAGGRVDVLLGCPPCQGFSEVGRRDAADPRNKHITRFCSFALATRPLAIGMENVPMAAISPEFERMVRRLEKAGYFWTAGIANAALYGSAQSRQRLIFVAIRGDVRSVPRLRAPTHGRNRKYFDYGLRQLMPLEKSRIAILGETPAKFRASPTLPASLDELGRAPIPCIAEVLDGLPRPRSTTARELAHEPFAHSERILKVMATVVEGGRWRGGADHYSHAYGRLHRRGIARTITTFFANAGSGRFWHPTENRALTVREAARLQGFPDSFALMPGRFLRNCVLVGNALDAALARLTYDTIRQAID